MTMFNIPFDLTVPETQAVTLILVELIKAKRQHPRWPADILEAGAIISEESGELIRECLQVYQGEKEDIVPALREAIQVGATAIRFLSSDPYTYRMLSDDKLSHTHPKIDIKEEELPQHSTAYMVYDTRGKAVVGLYPDESTASKIASYGSDRVVIEPKSDNDLPF